MKILHVSSEVAPFSKTGGLGDVVGSLPRAQRTRGQDVRVLTPLFRGIDRSGMERIGDGLLSKDGVWFLDAPHYYDRERLYDYPDDPLRFAHLCREAARLAVEHGFDVVHLHDWQAGLTALYLDGRVPTIQTIHNMAYQGLFGFEWADQLGIPEHLRRFDGVEFYGRISLLKAGLTLADRITTVSPTYAREILDEPGGCGLSALLRYRSDRLSGVLNGLDSRNWPDPPRPPKRDGTHCVLISRAVHQKGLDLVVDAVDALVAAGGRLSILSSGEPGIEEALRDAARRHPDAVHATIGFDVDYARQLYAEADFVLVPSRFEPCGLTQLIAMRYGAIPIVRRTGGLADTVEDGVTGIVFDAATAEACAQAIERALALSSAARMRLRANGRARDWSWHRAARQYADLYADLLAAR